MIRGLLSASNLDYLDHFSPTKFPGGCYNGCLTKNGLSTLCNLIDTNPSQITDANCVNWCEWWSDTWLFNWLTPTYVHAIIALAYYTFWIVLIPMMFLGLVLFVILSLMYVTTFFVHQIKYIYEDIDKGMNALAKKTAKEVINNMKEDFIIKHINQ